MPGRSPFGSRPAHWFCLRISTRRVPACLAILREANYPNPARYAVRSTISAGSAGSKRATSSWKQKKTHTAGAADDRDRTARRSLQCCRGPRTRPAGRMFTNGLVRGRKRDVPRTTIATFSLPESQRIIRACEPCSIKVFRSLDTRYADRRGAHAVSSLWSNLRRKHRVASSQSAGQATPEAYGC